MNWRLVWAGMLSAMVVGCGGGGGDSAPAPAPTATVPAVTALTLSGTAAKGAAIGAATVEVRCASGSGSVTSAGDGTFTLTLATGTLPCVLKAPVGDGTFLYSAIGGSGAGAFTVNISPLTQLVVAQATGVSPGTLFDEFTTRSTAVTTAALSDAVAAVKVTLLAAGVDLTGVDPLAGALIVGNAQDQKIDALVATLAANGTTLTQITETVAASSPVNTSTTPTTTTSGTASLPADLLLKPAAANCTALRSGDYRVVFFESSGVGKYATAKVTIDAAKLAVDNHDGSTDTLIPVGSCRFTNAGGAEIVVSQAGVIAIRAKNDAAVYRNGIAFPEQAHTVAEMAGVWNTLEFARDSDSASTFHAEANTVTLDSNGKVTAGTHCADVKTCVAFNATTLAALTLSANADGTVAAGGFNFTNSVEKWTSRTFAYRAGGGELMLVDISGDGSFSISTRQRTNTLPDVGAISRSFDVTTNNALLSPAAISESGNTIKATDTGTGAYIRTVFGHFNNGATFATWDQSLQANQPRAGYTFRLAENSVPTSASGVTATNREFVALGLRGMGLSAVSIPFNNSYILSVGQSGSTLLAPELIDKPFAANCSFLRSGKYRVVLFDSAPVGEFATDTVTVNAAALTTTDSSNTTDTLTPNGNCRYTNGGGADIVVSPAGVLAIRGGNGRGRVAFPEQAHTVAELAGTWNKLGFSGTSDAASVTIDASGLVTALSYCANVATCVDVTGKTITHALNSAGGFTRTSSDGWTDRVFAYRAGSGDLMLVNLSGDGSFGFWTEQRSISLPTVGTRTRNWDLNIDKQFAALLSDSATTIASVDSTAGSAVRSRTTGTGATYSETLRFNDPRNGFNFRPAATVAASDSTTINIREFTSLPMRGMGFSPLKFVGTPAESFIISVVKP